MKKIITAVAIAATLPWLGGGVPAPPAFTLEGIVMDRAQGTRVADAEVTLVRSGRTVTTDWDGYFTFRQIQIAAPEEIVVSHREYRTARFPLGALENGDWSLRISLLPYTVTVGGNPPEEPQSR